MCLFLKQSSEYSPAFPENLLRCPSVCACVACDTDEGGEAIFGSATAVWGFMASTDSLKLGAHVSVSRFLYSHHAIYIGDGMVVEYAGLGGSENSHVQKRWLEEMKGKSELVVVKSPRKFTPEEVVRRALTRLKEDAYHVIFNNCEHFCNWCRSGEARSHQVANVGRAIVLAGTAAVLGLLYNYTKKPEEKPKEKSKEKEEKKKLRVTY